MNMHFTYSRPNLFSGIILGLLCLILIVFLYIYVAYQDSRREIIQKNIEALSSEFSIAIGVYAEMSDFIFHSEIDTNHIKSIIDNGVNANSKEKADKYREMLHGQLYDIYQRITTYNFRQLHFHDNTNHSFLRFHRPQKYGDDLTGFRYSVEYVNKNKKFISGFEEGRIFNGYRFVYPLEYESRHIGSVEVSVSIKAVIEQINKLFNYNCQFIIKKNQVLSKVFEGERENYSEWKLAPDFLLDRKVGANCILSGHIPQGDITKLYESLKTRIATDHPFSVQITYDGYPSLVTFLPINNFQGICVGYLFAVTDNKELYAQDQNYILATVSLVILFVLLIAFLVYSSIMSRKMEQMATYDYLTKTFRRGVLIKAIELRFELFKRYQSPFAVIMLDIDHFKLINDKFGHGCGDLVLAKAAKLMIDSTRVIDLVGRYGGEEFLICLPETKQNDAVLVAEKIRKTIEGYVFDRVGHITISCGVMEVNKAVNNIEELCEGVDELLYQAKTQGRNRVVGA